MYVRPYEKDLLQYTSYRLHKYLLLYVPPIILLLGTVGNIFSIIILTRKSMRKYSTYFYLAVLAGVDTLVLYVGLLKLWVGELTGNDVSNYSNWTCKCISMLGYTLSDYSGWLIIAVTIERYLAVCRPLKALSCEGQRERAYKVVVVLFAFLFCINAHFFWTVEIRHIEMEEGRVALCDGGPSYTVLIDKVWPWVDIVIYSFLPFLIILVLNALIIRQVVRARHDRRALQTPGGAQVNTVQYMQHAAAADRGGKITVMLMTISFTFLLTTLPVTITNMVVPFLGNVDLSSKITFRLVRTIAVLLMHTNHCINFFLYCATGQKFRKQFVWLITNGARGSCGGNTSHFERRYTSCYPGNQIPAQSDYTVSRATTNGTTHPTGRHLLPLSELMILHPPTGSASWKRPSIPANQRPLLSGSHSG